MKHLLRYGLRIIIYFFLVRILEEILRSFQSDQSKNDFEQNFDKKVIERTRCQLKAGLSETAPFRVRTSDM